MGMLVKEVTSFQDGACWKVVGSNPGAGTCVLGRKFIHYLRVRSKMF